jgi:hypothetical protein
VAALGDWAAVRGEELRKRLAGPPLWQEPCYSATQRLTADGAAAALDRLGDMRFRQKAVAARRELQSWNRERGRLQALDEVLWAGVLNALGYGGQRELFGAVAAGLPWHECAGAVAGARSRERPLLAYQMLLRSLDAARLRLPVVLRPLRPGNRPEARLKGAAALAARYARRGLWAGVAPQVPEAAAGRPAALIRAFSVPSAVGRARALEIVANAVLPVAAAAGEAEAAEAAYGALPLPARYGPVRHIRAALGGDVPLNTRRQQGMLYLLRQYCTQGGCGRCPLS